MAKKKTKHTSKKTQQVQQTPNFKRIVLIIAITTVCVVGAIPLIDYGVMNGTYIRINKEKVSRLEYEYFFHINKVEQGEFYNSLMASMGMSEEADFSYLTLQTDSTIKDGVDEATVAGLITNRALLAEAEKEGFTYDASEEFAAFEETVEQAAAEADMSVSQYVKKTYGTYATMKRIAKFYKEDITASAFYDYKAEQLAPTEEELQEYYEANRGELDFFDFHMTVIKVEELEESDDLETVLAQAEENIWTEGELYEGITLSGLDSSMTDWLTDSERKANDSVVVKHTEKDMYYALGFVERYLDESWKETAKDAMVSEKMDAYMEEIQADMQVSDPKNNLQYD